MTESNVDMLRLEAPMNAVEIKKDKLHENTTVDLKNPPVWLRLLIARQRQAQQDLQQLYNMCDGAYDHTDRKIHAIEESYEELTATIKYVYQTGEKDTQISKQ